MDQPSDVITQLSALLKELNEFDPDDIEDIKKWELRTLIYLRKNVSKEVAKNFLRCKKSITWGNWLPIKTFLTDLIKEIKKYPEVFISTQKSTHEVTPMRRIPSNSRECFVIMSYDEKGGERYNEVLAPAIREAIYEPFLVREGSDPNWCREIISHLKGVSALALVDLTGMRFNCIWELGLAHAFECPVLVIIPKDDEKHKIPSDFFWQRAIPYNMHGPDGWTYLRKEIPRRIKKLMDNPNQGKLF